MSTVLGISAVTAVLQYYLGNAYSGTSALFGGTVAVSAIAPDLVQNVIGDGSSPQNQINLFLHQVTYNANWRNVGQPSLGADGKTQLKNPPLALDLHYLLTAYGSADWQAEGLLGYALLLLHQNPVLTRLDISNALGALPTNNPNNPLSTALKSSGLADQIEMIKITPSTLGREEMAWLWTALKADYRPTFPFQVSVVLIQTQPDISFAFPVLSRNIKVQPITPARILQIAPPTGQAAAASGDSVTATGEFLSGASKVSLTNPRLSISTVVSPASVSNGSLSFVVPAETATSAFPAGVYNLALLFMDASGAIVQSTNALPFAVAPTITNPSQATVVQNASGTLITITCNPMVRQSQSASLILNGTAVSSQPINSATNSLSFQFTPALAGWFPTGATASGRSCKLINNQLDKLTSRLYGSNDHYMTADESMAWTDANQAFLVAEFARLKALLGSKSGEHAAQPVAPPAPTPQPPSAIDGIAQVFGLSTFERDILLLCAGVEMDSQMAALCAEAQGHPQRTYATFGLAMSALANPHWSALTPARPLRRFRLVEMQPGQGLASAPMRINERVLHLLAGINMLDSRLEGLVTCRAPSKMAAAEHKAVAARISSMLDKDRAQGFVFQLCGDDPDGQEDVAGLVAVRCDQAGSCSRCAPRIFRTPGPNWRNGSPLAAGIASPGGSIADSMRRGNAFSSRAAAIDHCLAFCLLPAGSRFGWIAPACDSM